MARVVRFHELGGPEVLRIEEESRSEPLAADEVRITVKALGLNRADVMFRRGTYIEKAVLPSRLGYEASGLIEAVGAEVIEFQQGQAVSVIPPIGLGRYGTYGESIVVPARFVAPKPESLSFELAASAWMQYLTAYGGLIEAGGLRQGEHVLITAASSSVGLAAIQIARSVGAIPLATTLDRSKKDAVLALGPAHVIATREEDLGEELLKIVGSDGLQRAFDAVGGPQVEAIAAAMAPGGVIVSHGMLDPAATPFPLRLALRKSLTMRGYVFTETVGNPAKLAAAKRFILEGLSSGALHPVIDKVFAFDDIVEAHRYLESNQHIGKVVVTV
ncbi:NADPH:quinone reductase [Comamonas thiooxydans]|uniref:NADPH:quinone reductase n=1 Tax=Comamonas thiooxydans TaxID=363952 RepID=A0A0E3BU84_9BURK|nr:zinc-dependent alcohol dehydrogenase family protein [Comamonas thiooxydans]KGH08339.1 NADPH:quinone reductase [Comamonas thiooxydans]KGH26306.1 NADPH:quinone reductase [Comamonas thiooxydans]